MKWEELNQKYPHAIQDLMSWMVRADGRYEKSEKIFAKTPYGFAVNVVMKKSEQDEGTILTMGRWDDIEDNDRELYDFFDYKGIYVLIVLRGVNSWVYDIRNPQLDLLACTPHWEKFSDRWLAEADAFEKAFWLLEKIHEQS